MFQSLTGRSLDNDFFLLQESSGISLFFFFLFFSTLEKMVGIVVRTCITLYFSLPVPG